MANDINFDSFFDEKITDNNGIPSTDINAGLNNLHKYFNEVANNLYPIQNYLVAEHEEGYPDLVAKNSMLGAAQYWWWLLLLNRLDDPFEDIKENFVYSINSHEQINNIIEGSNNANDNEDNSRIGTVIELN